MRTDLCTYIIIMISHFGFLIGGGDENGDGDFDVIGASIYM